MNSLGYSSSADSSPRGASHAVMAMGGDLYDTSSDISSPDSPMGYSNFNPLPYPTYPYSVSSPGYMMGPNQIPIELVGDGQMAGGDRRRRKGAAADKDGLSPVHSRRRAQNRASQRAFRDRKEKHVKDLERRLSELEDKNQTLEQAYSELSSEHNKLKREMEHVSTENDVLRSSPEAESMSSFLNDLDADNDFEKILSGEVAYSGSSFCFGNEALDSYQDTTTSVLEDAL